MFITMRIIRGWLFFKQGMTIDELETRLGAPRNEIQGLLLDLKLTGEADYNMFTGKWVCLTNIE